MAWRQHMTFDAIQFVREKEAVPLLKEKHKVPSISEDGSEVRSFYEQVTASSSKREKEPSNFKKKRMRTEAVTKPYCKSQSKRRESPNHKRKKVQNCSQEGFLRSAQNGDCEVVEELLSSGSDIDQQDSYGWTALMCATEAGQTDLVKLLLSHHADTSLSDKRGLTAADIARKKKRHDIYKLLKNSTDKPEESLDTKNLGSTTAEATFFCDICKTELKDTTKNKHNASTLHLFNIKLTADSTNYCIPEGNPGFQIMLRTGWDKEQGLGPDGQGDKYPVKTMLKRDRKGLGAMGRTKAKVTHFAPDDKEAIRSVTMVKQQSERSMRAVTVSKRQSTALAKKQRQKEINFRREFNME